MSERNHMQIGHFWNIYKCKFKSKMRKCRNYWSSVWEIISSQKINSEQRSLLSLWEPEGHLHINTNVGEYADANLIKSMELNGKKTMQVHQIIEETAKVHILLQSTKMFAQEKISWYGWLMQTAYNLEIIYAQHLYFASEDQVELYFLNHCL